MTGRRLSGRTRTRPSRTRPPRTRPSRTRPRTLGLALLGLALLGLALLPRGGGGARIVILVSVRNLLVVFVFVVVVVSWGWSGRSSVLFFTLRRLSRRLGAGDDLDESAQARAILRHLGSHGVQGHLVAFKFEVDVEMSETSGVSSRGGVYASRVVGGDGCFHRGCALRARFDAKALESRAAGVVLGVRDGGRGRVVAAFTEGARRGSPRGSPRARSRPQPARLPSGWGCDTRTDRGSPRSPR